MPFIPSWCRRNIDCGNDGTAPDRFALRRDQAVTNTEGPEPGYMSRLEKNHIQIYNMMMQHMKMYVTNCKQRICCQESNRQLFFQVPYVAR